MGRRRKYQDHLDGAKYAMKYAVCVFNNVLLDNRIEQCVLSLFNAWTYMLIATCKKLKLEYIKESNSKLKHKKEHNSKEYKNAYEMFQAINVSDNHDKNAIYKNFLLIKEIRDYIVHRHPSVSTKDLRDLYPRLQTCLDNLQWWLCEEFGEENKISISFSIPLYLYEEVLEDQVGKKIRKQKDIGYIINQFERNIENEVLLNPRYCRKIAIFVGELKNHQSEEAINFAKISVGDDINFANPNTIIGLKITSDTEKFTLLPQRIVDTIKKSYPEFTMTRHTNAFKHFTKDGKLFKKQYWVQTSEGKRFYSQEWVDYLMEEIKKDPELLKEFKINKKKEDLNQKSL
jgi:hypothetical protein